MDFLEVTWALGTSWYVNEMEGMLGLGYDSEAVGGLNTFMTNSNLTDKSFSFYLKDAAEDSYMLIPGMDEENYGIIDTHKVVEQKFWSIQLDSIAQGENVIDASNYQGVIHSRAALITGPKEIIDPLIAGITVKENCFDLDLLPNITFTFDGTAYVLTPYDYVISIIKGGAAKCILGVQSMETAGAGYIIIGNVFIKKYPSYFNFNDNTVSFMVGK